MKKKVDYITVSNELAQFLIKSLEATASDTKIETEKSELKSSLQELISGQTNSLFPCFKPWRSFYKRADLLRSMERRLFSGRKQYYVNIMVEKKSQTPGAENLGSNIY